MYSNKKKTYTFGDIIIREVKSRYYVYLSRVSSTDGKEHYVGPLDDVIKSYLKMEENSLGVGIPHTAAAGI
ncbi:putative integrase [Acidianus manzaensis]|uniref:putative integrase n=1 Tax=Acidianus manzaensis TaxID=282676 RepID=UPI001F373B76|nr:putative integrase [Acidianus manzaensis]